MEKEEFRKFLAEQISLPREKWDKRFKKVPRKIRFNQRAA